MLGGRDRHIDTTRKYLERGIFVSEMDIEKALSALGKWKPEIHLQKRFMTYNTRSLAEVTFGGCTVRYSTWSFYRVEILWKQR